MRKQYIYIHFECFLLLPWVNYCILVPFLYPAQLTTVETATATGSSS